MGPTAGRSVLVTTDLAQAFMRLKSIISQNKVRQDFHSQRFHERPGLKRKRLRSERHRRRFKEGFKRMVSIVMDMKKKGM
jgi:small subunit ribosomal protein MRP21